MLSFVRNRQTIFQAVLLFSIPTSNEWRWTHLINSFFNKQVVLATLPPSELIFHITFFRPPFLGEWPHSSPGYSCVSSSLFHANELAAKFSWLSHLAALWDLFLFSILSAFIYETSSFWFASPSHCRQLSSKIPCCFLITKKKKNQNLKFSHWLQVKLPTALDGL